MASTFTSFLSFFLLYLSSAQVGAFDRKKCLPFNCGTVPNIQFPFSNDSNPECGIYNITCKNDYIPKIKFEKNGKEFVVNSISFESRLLAIQDKGLLQHNKSQVCNNLHNFTVPISPFLTFKIVSPNYTIFKCNRGDGIIPAEIVNLYNYTECTDYVLYYTKESSVPAIKHNCSVLEYPVSEWLIDPYGSKIDLLTLLAAAFGLQWNLTRECEECYLNKGGYCNQNEVTKQFICSGPFTVIYKNKNYNKKKIMIGATAAGVFVLFLACFSIFFLSTITKSSSTPIFFFWEEREVGTRNVETFLQHYGSFAPTKYRFSELKEMTNSFKDKLGQGGYGGVFKGKLDDGRLVAVKVLNNSKGSSGEEFINEVASIGRTNHVNVVPLLGFCSDGSKRALIYEYMPNGSLEKFIYSKKQGATQILEFEKLFQIAVGIARGLEYLHRGCSIRILHFDIKPHNILLDKDFCPKISDFGLAKLCPNPESTVSMLDARGTIGYIAPEVFCRNIGGVSHKSDVYSYGMMVLEMVGGRKNIDLYAQNTSEIYFPHWVYNHINLQESLEFLGITTELEEKVARKMILVGLWCIQTDPANRPSMSKVLEMLEGSLDCIQVPPKPYLSSPTRECQSSSTT